MPVDRYIVDFYCKDLKFAIEVDGAIHFREGQQEQDKKRQARLESLGVTVIRFMNAEVENKLTWVL